MKWGYGFMERKILIIGNGFDLYHGLPTRYTDFLFFADNWKIFKDEYDKHCKKGEALRGEAIKVRLSERKTLTEESLLDFSIHTDLYCEDHISFLDEHLQNNAWLNFFRENRIPGRNWIDFEAEIERALNQVELFYSEILPSSKNKIPTLNMPVFMKNVISTFSIKAKEAEIGYQTLTNTMFRPNDWDFDSLNRNKTLLLESMKKELDDLNKCLNYYMLDFVSALDICVYSEQIKDLGDIYLLNFNYTYTFAAIYGKRALIEHHPIHGEAKEEDLVLGIPDEAFPNSLDYIYFQKYFQRIQKKTGNYYKEWPVRPDHPTLEDSQAKVYIMGHSLDKVDKGVLKDFFEEQNVKLIKIFYHSQLDYENKVINLVDMFGKDFVIDQTNQERILFEELRPAVAGKPREE